MNRIRPWLVAALLLSWTLLDAAPLQIGVLVVHGKQGAPDRDVVLLAQALRGRGFAVEVPIMPWARGRIYAASYGEALNYMDDRISALRGRGAGLIIIAGHSLGANAALGYAATHSRLDGLVLLAPGHFPENPRYQERVAPERAKALKLIAAGQGGRIARFQDVIQGHMIDVRATPAVFLVYTDPAGPAIMSRNAAAIRRPMPILLIQENNPAVAAADQNIFRQAPPDPLSRYLVSPASHVRVPNASVSQVLQWLEQVAQASHQPARP
jgi:pimeloyl-ACP methyl ester carboxylesterase